MALWDMQPWDTEASFACFRIWLFQEKRPRSLDAAYRAHVGREYSKSGQTITASNNCYDWYHARKSSGEPRLHNGEAVPTWEERARAYDTYLAELDRLEWEKRRAEIRQRGFESWEALNEKADQMLQFPLQTVSTTEYYDDGRQKTIIVEPGKWSLRDAAMLKKIAEELGRLSAEMANERTELMLPRELVEIWGPFTEALKDAGIDPIEALKAMIGQVKANDD